MWLIGNTLARSAGPHGVTVALLRYGARGWNAGGAIDPAPVTEGRAALRALRERYGEAPVVLVGHSMGGRAVCALAAEPGVRGVVALAPWLPEGEPVRVGTAQRLIMAHGTADRWTSPPGSLAWARRARRAGAGVARFELEAAGHFMFGRPGEWNQIVRDSTLGLLGVRPLDPTVSAALAATGDDGLRLPSGP